MSKVDLVESLEGEKRSKAAASTTATKPQAAIEIQSNFFAFIDIVVETPDFLSERIAEK